MKLSTTIGIPKHAGKKPPYPLKPVISAYIAQSTDPGFAVPPPLIGEDTVEKSIIQFRQRNHAEALKLITKEEWKDYYNYGIQQFVAPRDYLRCVAQETSDDKDLCLFCYPCLHQEADAEVNQYLNRSADIIRDNFLANCSHLANMTMKEIDDHCANTPKQFAVNRFAAHIATAPSTDSTVEPMADTDDDKEKFAMPDTDDDKENNAKTAKLAPVKEITSRPFSIIHIVV